MPQDNSVCRFCLDDESTKKNPLIEPCLCKGSIQFVHILCLNKWRLLNPARNADICFLCLEPYHLGIGEILEHLPDESSFRVMFLRFPFLLFGLINYFAAIHYSAIQKKDFSSFFQYYQFFFQILYGCLFVSIWHVRNKSLYWKHWNVPFTYTVLITHCISNGCLVMQMPYAVLPLNFCFLYYYRMHRAILMRMNTL